MAISSEQAYGKHSCSRCKLFEAIRGIFVKTISSSPFISRSLATICLFILQCSSSSHTQNMLDMVARLRYQRSTKAESCCFLVPHVPSLKSFAMATLLDRLFDPASHISNCVLLVSCSVLCKLEQSLVETRFRKYKRKIHLSALHLPSTLVSIR